MSNETVYLEATPYLEALAGDEGFSDKIYYDEYHHATLGIGLNLDAGIDYEMAYAAMAAKYYTLHRTLNKIYPFFDFLSSPRQYVLVNMAYNMGLTGLASFRDFLAALEKFDYEGASAALIASNYYRQVGPRARRLADVIHTNEMPQHQPILRAPFVITFSPIN